MPTVGELLARMQAEDRELLDVAAECGVALSVSCQACPRADNINGPCPCELED